MSVLPTCHIPCPSQLHSLTHPNTVRCPVHTIKLLVTQLYIASSEPLSSCVPVFSPAHCFYTQIVLSLCSSHKMAPSDTRNEKQAVLRLCIFESFLYVDSKLGDE